MEHNSFRSRIRTQEDSAAIDPDGRAEVAATHGCTIDGKGDGMSINRHVAGALVITAALIAGCAQDKHEPATPVSTSSPLTSKSVSPPTGVDFPDLSQFTEDTSGRYEQVNVPRVQGFSFSTAGGLICGSNAYPDVEYEQIGCRGAIPAQGPGDWSVSAHASEAATVEPIPDDPDLAAARQSPPPVLEPSHKVQAAKGIAVCAVGTAGLTACIVGDHGFVLTPTATTLF